VEERLLAQGYALAGSGYPNDNKQGILATHALTEYFNGRVGNPSRTIVWGNSLGGLLSLMLIERHPGIYDGAIANCTPAAGDLGDMDWALTWSLAYSAVFGWREDLWGPIGDLRDNIDFFTEAAPFLQWPDRLYLKHWGEPQGAMRRPVLTMHAIFDGLAPVGDEGVYAARVAVPAEWPWMGSPIGGK